MAKLTINDLLFWATIERSYAPEDKRALWDLFIKKIKECVSTYFGKAPNGYSFKK